MEQEKFSEETIVEVRHNFYSNKKEWTELGNRVTYTFKLPSKLYEDKPEQLFITTNHFPHFTCLHEEFFPH
ncbi:MAG: hypothetical protein DRN49_03730 [Thaumarchaeota archaeon]|nr:MAG: hypothetical protein DRN49_03730 [Nitrososphaerota archaeon]